MRFAFRKFFVALLAVVAVSAVAASAASAAPEFKNKEGKEVVKKGFTGKSGVIKLRSGTTTFKCNVGKLKGEISGRAKVAKVVETFTECRSGSEQCAIKSQGAAKGEIKTDELEGELGKVTKAEAASERGLDLFPRGKSGFAVLEGEPEGCIPATEVEGSIIGEVTPVKKLQSTDNLTYTEKLYKQGIQKFEGKPSDVLKAFGALLPETMTDEVTFDEEVEVT